jgi:hypothetical protein
MARAMGTVTRVVGEQWLRGLVCWGWCCRMAPLLQGSGGRGGEAALPLWMKDLGLSYVLHKGKMGYIDMCYI